MLFVEPFHTLTKLCTWAAVFDDEAYFRKDQKSGFEI
jgi:hypothetical protein